jgi:hypothetical protein
MANMLTREEVQEQLSSITKQVNSGYGVKGGANKRTALEDAYAYWLAANQDRVKMKDFADFLQLDADAAQNAYLPEGGFGYRDVVDFDEIDFEGIAGPPPKGYTGDINYESIQNDNFDALFDRIDAAKIADPFVAYVLSRGSLVDSVYPTDTGPRFPQHQHERLRHCGRPSRTGQNCTRLV